MHYNLLEFGEKLKAVRIKNGYTQKQVCELTGISEDTSRKIENGRVLPRIDTLDKYALVYKQDIYLLFSRYRITFDNYFSDRIRTIANDFKNYKFDKIKIEADTILTKFKEYGYLNDVLIEKKRNQYYEYLCSLHNIHNSFDVKSRKDLTKLFAVLDYNLNDFIIDSKQINPDKLEILILILISIIYRYKNEFKNSRIILDKINNVLIEKYLEDADFLYYYIIIVYNKMTLSHRMSDFADVESIYLHSMNIINDKLDIQNFSTLLMRVGINRSYKKEKNYNEMISAAIQILDDIGKDKLAMKYKNQIKSLYDI